MELRLSGMQSVERFLQNETCIVRAPVAYGINDMPQLHVILLKIIYFSALCCLAAAAASQPLECPSDPKVQSSDPGNIGGDRLAPRSDPSRDEGLLPFE